MFGRRSQDDFEEEIRAHLQMEVDRLIATGMSPKDAEHAARRSFGNVAAAEEHFYQHQRLAWMSDTGRDLQQAWRSLLRTPGFLVACVATLALAMGAVAGMFSVVHAVLLEPLPFPAPDRLVALFGNSPGSDLPKRFGLSNEFYLHYKERSKLLAGLFSFSDGTSTFRAGDRVERIPMAWPTNDMYATLGVRPKLGRLPVAADNDDAVVISDRLWESWFGRDSSVIGKWYFVSDSLKQIIGIMPASFHFPNDDNLLWISGEVRLDQLQPGNFGLQMVARMKQGVTPEQVAVELTQLGKELPGRFGGSPVYARIMGQYRSIVSPLAEEMVGPTLRTSLFVLLGGVAVVLLIACANVANLFLVRAESRRRDLTVRRAIGASSAQLARFQMAEAVAVALAAGVLAIGLAAATLPIFLHAAPTGIPRLSEVRLDAPTLAATFGLVLLVALGCGAAPALRASSPDLSGLREGGRGSSGSVVRRACHDNAARPAPMHAMPVHSLRLSVSPKIAIDSSSAITGTMNMLSDAVPAGSQRRISIHATKPTAVAIRLT
jgi:putative ABC transport system permease protein